MQQNNSIYAQILESQGFVKEALDIYEQLLKKNPNNKEINESIHRLKNSRKKFENVDIKKRDFFINMKSEKDFIKFEEWLSKL
jgi:tetratricopeptide (TPR) repeat protein